MERTLFPFAASLLVASFVGGGAATLLFGQSTAATATVIRAERIEVVDHAGVVRAHLETDAKTGIANLSLFDANRKLRAWLSASDRPALILWDAAGTPRVSVSLSPAGAPALEMRDSIESERRPAALRVALGAVEQQLPGGLVATLPVASLTLFDGAGRPLFKAPR